MSILGNILWLIFGGVFSAIGWFLAGIICCITIIGIPIGLQCFKFAKMVIWPFGTQIDYGNLNSGSIILNVIWILFCGVELAISSLTMGAICCLTIIGIPFGIQHFKFAGLALLPFGAQIRRFI
ncbi:YccF domain-containing protein [Anaerotignum sp.]|uniref:YccF domain-containing protein n=1 Tax=Anaerotignum sp. TaxID=2039241 RepID=UPI0028AB936A|nr:YccF domain-containing protein [Anaerotignum sp.]